MSDNINHPAHYNKGIECIDVIQTVLGREGCAAFCIGNAIKYIYRHDQKGHALEDIKKAIWYLNKYIELMGGVSRETTGKEDNNECS